MYCQTINNNLEKNLYNYCLHCQTMNLRATPPDGVNFIPYMKLLGVE
jgi:hypothetical protein